MKSAKFFVAITCLAAIPGCQAIGTETESPVSQSLAPMQKPKISVGDKWYGIENGKEEVFTTVVAQDGDRVSAERSDGCSWTNIAWGFAPSDKWAGCKPFTDGTHKITAVEGEIWPLEVGKTIVYDLAGKNVSGGTWTGRRSCKVEGEVHIKTVSGEYDTYKVACRDKWTDRVWYISPKEQTAVYFERYHKTRNLRTKVEMTRVERAAPSY